MIQNKMFVPYYTDLEISILSSFENNCNMSFRDVL